MEHLCKKLDLCGANARRNPPNLSAPGGCLDYVPLSMMLLTGFAATQWRQWGRARPRSGDTDPDTSVECENCKKAIQGSRHGRCARCGAACCLQCLQRSPLCPFCRFGHGDYDSDFEVPSKPRALVGLFAATADAGTDLPLDCPKRRCGHQCEYWDGYASVCGAPCAKDVGHGGLHVCGLGYTEDNQPPRRNWHPPRSFKANLLSNVNTTDPIIPCPTAPPYWECCVCSTLLDLALPVHTCSRCRKLHCSSCGFYLDDGDRCCTKCLGFAGCDGTKAHPTWRCGMRCHYRQGSAYACASPCKLTRLHRGRCDCLQHPTGWIGTLHLERPSSQPLLVLPRSNYTGTFADPH